MNVKIQKHGAVLLTWFRFGLSVFVLVLLWYLALYYKTFTYLVYQGKGQLRILTGSKPIDQFTHLPSRQTANLRLVDGIKKYSVDSLGYDPTNNFNELYDHGADPMLWVVTASEAYSLQPRYWNFPIVGQVTYKGFFDHYLAATEYEHLVRQGYDVEVSPVIAYSTLGWFSDPLFTGMLERNKGSFCNLLFHELFHATYYKPGKINLNENLASFVAHKATVQFLKNDTAALRIYMEGHSDQELIRRFLHRQYHRLSVFYEQAWSSDERTVLKTELFKQIADSICMLPVHNPKRVKSRASQVISARNAYFVGFKQYESLQDSLENVFNKFYRRSIKNLVHDLKRR